MTKNLVIVESPAKARTVSRYLGKDFQVEASVGHIRDLPSKEMAVDIDNNFTPSYVIMPGKKSIVQNLKKLARNAENIYLATDPDREGEAISWHILESISSSKTPPTQRVVFHEITEQGIKEAFNNPGDIDMQLVNAQQARRILDRVVGYQLSPLLQKKFTSGRKLGLSAGRVQSVALKIIVEREREISSFIPKEYWNVTINLSKSDSNKTKFEAKLNSEKINSESEATELKQILNNSTYKVEKISVRNSSSKAPAPFTTSTLQQEASRRLRYTATRTMRVAQQLYEGINIGSEGETGLITYMRTDSITLSSIASSEITDFIKDVYGEDYVSNTKHTVRKKAVAAQEAHEAIRPTSVLRTPDNLKNHLTREQLSLYTLIWRRTVASKMSNAINQITTVNILSEDINKEQHKFICSGSIPQFDGFRILYENPDHDPENDADENEESSKKLPKLSKDDDLKLNDIANEQKFTLPPARYTQATLVKKLEESGIGRPSTYASIMSTLEGRNYCTLVDGKYQTEQLGEAIVDQLNPYFPNIMDVEFTASMETNLDEIAKGNKEWISVLQDFYNPYSKLYAEAESTMPKVTVETPTGDFCPQCEKPLVEKIGRNGKFIACSGFPECRYSKNIINSTDIKCPICVKENREGEIIERQQRKGQRRKFYGCSAWPNCNFISNAKPIEHPCPECNGLMVESTRDRVICYDKDCAITLNANELKTDPKLIVPFNAS